MILKCVRDKGWDLQAEYRGLHVSAETMFYLTVDATYPAYGLALYNGGLCALVVDNTQLPSWYPIEAFKVVDGTIPPDWRFVVRPDGGPTGLQALWGYGALVDDPPYIKALTELEPPALAAFFDVVKRYGDE